MLQTAPPAATKQWKVKDGIIIIQVHILSKIRSKKHIKTFAMANKTQLLLKPNWKYKQKRRVKFKSQDVT